METTVNFKGIEYTVEYEKDGADITIIGVYYEKVDMCPILDSLNFEYADLTELVNDNEVNANYEE